MPTYGLQFSDIYGFIQDYANINNITSSATKAKKAANNGLRFICSLRNWEALKRESTITPVSGTQSYNILSGTPDFDHIISVWYFLAGERLPIDIVDDDKWSDNMNNTLTGTPQICRVTKTSGTLQIQFSLIPDSSFITQAGGVINFDYIKKPVEMSADTDIPEIPDTDEQMAIVYAGISDLLGKQGDLDGMNGWEAKAKRLIEQANKIDDKKQGRYPRLGKPMIPISTPRKGSMLDYKGGQPYTP